MKIKILQNKKGINMTREQKEERKIELVDNLLFGEKNDSKMRSNKRRTLNFQKGLIACGM